MIEQAQAKAAFLKENQQEGELYGGILLGKNGEPDEHVFLLPWEANGVTWSAAKQLAAKVGGELPSRRVQALLFANLKEQFQPQWYWSSEQHDSFPVCAWVQYFGYGYQDSGLKSNSYRARAVRRLKIS